MRDLGRCKNGRALVCAGRQEVRTILIWMPAASARRFLLVEPRVLLSPSEMWFTPIEMTSGLMQQPQTCRDRSSLTHSPELLFTSVF